MERRQTISRPSFGKQPSVIASNALEGVMVTYRPPPNLPSLVHLAGITLPMFPGQKGFSYDFSVENKVVEECKADHCRIVAQASVTRQLKLRMEKNAAANSKPAPPLVVVPQGPTLTPIPAPTTPPNGSETSGSTGARSNLNLKDFETDGDPFETVTLKSINERAELESIWGASPQTEAQPTQALPVPQPQPRATETSHPASGMPMPSAQTAGMNQSLVGGGSQIDRAPSPDAQGRPVPKPRRFVPPKSSNSPTQHLGTSPVAHSQALGGSAVGSVAPVLANVSDVPVPVVTQTPAPVTAAAATTQPPALPHPTPPLVAPKPLIAAPSPAVVPPPYTPTSIARSNSPSRLPPLNHQPPVVLNNHTVGLPSQSGNPPHAAVGGVRVLPTIGFAGALHNSTSTARADPPPAYTDPSMPAQPLPVFRESSTAARTAARPAPRPPQYTLEDVRESLADVELDEVLQVAGMGFDEARVARAYKRLKKDQAKVLDFLFLVGKLEELGYNGNSAETALISCDGKTNEAVDYLKQVMRYREMGYQEKGIHEAYQKSSKDWDKTLDILLQQQ